MLGLVAFFSGLLGLAVGSFLNVVAYRVPLGKSLTSPPSSCPGCGAFIRPRDNLPVFGWLLLRGRCRDCRNPIPVRYPIVELVSGLLWVATTLLIGLSWVLPAYLWFVSVTLVLVSTDLEHHRLPNRIVLHGTWVGLVLLAGGGIADGATPGRMAWSVAAGIGYFVVMLAIALAARGGFGFGDVKLAAMLGLFVGYQPLLPSGGPAEAVGGVLVALFGAVILGGLVAILLLVLRRRERRSEIAFGPAMIVAAWLAAGWGSEWFSAYLGL